MPAFVRVDLEDYAFVFWRIFARYPSQSGMGSSRTMTTPLARVLPRSPGMIGKLHTSLALLQSRRRRARRV